MIGVLLAAAAVCAYLNAVRGGFVYDDARQIVGNTLIQDSARLKQAMLSDVWAFKGSATGTRVSNYWRPSFVLWMIANVRAFGLSSTVGWHLGNIALHALSTVLAFGLLRRLGLSAGIAGAIGLIFAVHPSHVESVAWISGAPDLILAPALLGSMWFVLNLVERSEGGAGRRAANWAAAIGLYVIAQGAKEVAIFYPVPVALLVRAASRSEAGRAEAGRGPARAPGAAYAAPFAVLGALYLLARSRVLGAAPAGNQGTVPIWADLWSAPQVAAFYLRQMVFPLWLGPSYPARPVSPEAITLTNFTLPLLVCVVAGLWMLREAWKSPIAALGLATFVLTLAPAMHVSAFMPEHIVHDRYLYLPLLGFLMIVVPAVARWTNWATRGGQEAPTLQSRRWWHGLAVAAAVCVPLTVQTLRYNTAWASEVSLWRWAIRTDPGSVSNLTQLAVQLRVEAQQAGGPGGAARPWDAAKLREAWDAANRAVELGSAPAWYALPDVDGAGPEAERIRPELPNALLVRADLAVDQRMYEPAERDLLRVLRIYQNRALNDDVFMAYERLAQCYDRWAKPAQAEAALREGRERLPHKWCALTEMLAIVLVNQKRFEDALHELEGARARVPKELSAQATLVLYRLGLMYEGFGRPAESAAAFREFLERTGTLGSPILEGPRREAAQRVRR